MARAETLRTTGRLAGISNLLIAAAAMLALGGVVLPIGSGSSAPSAAAYAGHAIGQPDHLVVPSLHIKAPVSAIEIGSDGTLYPPADVDTVGWWKRSAPPGARHGQVLITGHTVHVGDGAMDHIGEVKRGAQVRVDSGRKSVLYRVTKTMVLSKAQVAKKANRLFGQGHGGGQLVLVTCTDYNGSGYDSNVIVLAAPVRTLTR
jgi:LPXTG-site transpeptidase (sortase) family protein